MLVNLDLHIHSRYSMAVSADMELAQIARGAAQKGVKIVGTGDCLHPLWLKSIRELPEEEGLRRLGDILFLLSVEVEDAERVHHLILLPDASKAEELAEAFSPHSGNLQQDGRPRLHLNGAQIADLALEAGGLVGPAHAFTPWTGMYAYHRSLSDCYQENADRIDFIELGLSADTDYADRIAELSDKTFLSNSDAHSPRTNKLAREFNQMRVEGCSFQEVASAIRREKGRGPTLNAGFFPGEGKYNRTACTRCFQQYSPVQKDEFMGRCPHCRGLIKLGVADRIGLLADYELPCHPPHRPPYIHLIPLAEIIALALGHKSPMTAGVQKQYEAMTRDMAEIEVLLIEELEAMEAAGVEAEVIRGIEAFRKGCVEVLPGGGGRYGQILLPAWKKVRREKKQRSLFDFQHCEEGMIMKVPDDRDK